MHTETREGSRCNCCWVKECLPITSMAGATIFSVMQKIAYTYGICPGKTVKIVGSLKSAKVKGKALAINRSFKSAFNNKTSIAIHCVLSFNLPIRFVVLWATSCNNLEWFLFNSMCSLAIFRAAKINIFCLEMFDNGSFCWLSTRATASTKRSATSFALVTSESALNVCGCPKSSMVTICSNSY